MTDMVTLPDPAPAPPAGVEVYAVFCGTIDQNATARILQNLAVASNPQSKIKRVHLLFQTLGGNVADGVCLYNFFKAYPIDFTIYNVGSVQSIGVIAYLGAKERKTSASATFLIHRTAFSPQAAKSASLQALAKSATIDDQRTEKILKAHVTLPKKTWADLDHHDITFAGTEAVKLGFATSLGEFAPPTGAQIYNV